MQDTPARERNPYRQALRQLRRTFLQVGPLSAAVNILMLTGPIYMLQVYDRVLSSGSVATLQGLFVIVVVLYAFLGLYDFLRSRLLSRASYQLDSLVADKAFGHWLHTGASERQGGDNPMRDLDVVRGFVGGPAVAGLFDLPWIPLFLALVFFIHPWLGWLTLGGAVVVAVAAWLNQAVTRQATSEAMGLEGSERNFADRSRRDAEAVRALGMHEKVIRRWRAMHETALARGQQASERSEAFAAFSKSFRLLLQSGLLTLGAFLAIRQEVSGGAIVATSIIAGRALSPVDQVIGQWRAIGRAAEAHRRLLWTLDFTPKERPHIRLPKPRGLLEVNRVTKLVPGQTRIDDKTKIFDRLTFTLHAGDGLGVIGNSAAGKSSLARLLVGIWQPDLGEVRLDGATLDQWHPDDLGPHIGYLPQAFGLLPGSIAENIARFDPGAKDSDIIEAARIAGVHEMILGFPDGYSTMVGGSAQPLSGGQIQRLGLARAIYGRPRLIVLDEPNSNLDSHGDEALTQAILTMREKGSIVVVMAHRPSVIAAVNKILILHQGLGRFGDRDEVMRPAVRSAESAETESTETEPVRAVVPATDAAPSVPTSRGVVTPIAAAKAPAAESPASASAVPVPAVAGRVIQKLLDERPPTLKSGASQ